MPYCPSCGVRVAPGASRCRLDGALLRKLECPACQGEVSPGERFCGHCRQSLVQRPGLSRPLELRPAPWGRRLGALLFDLIAFPLLASCFFNQIPVLYFLPGLPLWVCIWEAADSATPGQQVFSLKRLGRQGESLGWRHAAACLAAFCLPWSRGSTRLYWVPS
ncbi:zinc ribbon domain-containing protein [bacterium]|nr:zinc ribbon domain-containing protein [bacterium]